MIKQILFDCGGVLTHMGFRDLMLHISHSEEIAEYFITHLWAADSPWQRYDKGELSDTEITEELKIFMPEEYHGYLEQFLDTWLDALPPRNEMEPILDELKEKGYSCYLLSNFPKRFKEMPQRVPFLNKLDKMIVSSDINLVKPNREIFEYTAKILNIKPSETLFVDDTQSNLDGAKKAGFCTYLFTEPDLFKDYLLQNYIL